MANMNENEKFSFIQDYIYSILSQNAKLKNNNDNNGIDEPNQTSFELNQTESHGRSLIAARDIHPGEIIFSEPPAVLSVKLGDSPTCLNCFKSFSNTTTWPTCIKCGCPLCENCGGNYHKNIECEILAKLCFVNRDPLCPKEIGVLNALLTPLKTWLIMTSHVKLGQMVNSLQSNTTMRKLSPINSMLDKIIYDMLQNLEVSIQKEDIYQIMGVFDTNAFEVDLGNGHLARALLPLAAIMNHSCTPNTQHWFYNGQLITTAAVFIKKGSEITNNYSNILWGNKTRKQHLKFTKFFSCKCPRCEDITELGTFISSVICPNCKNGLCSPNGKKWVCSECTEEPPKELIEMMLKAAISFTSAQHIADNKEIYDNIHHLTQKLGNHHYIVVELKYLFIKKILLLHNTEFPYEYFDAAIEWCQSLINLIEVLEPGFSRFRGLLLLFTLKLLIHWLDKYYNEEENIMKKFLETFKLKKIEDVYKLIFECSRILIWDEKFNDLSMAFEHFKETIKVKDIKEFTTDASNWENLDNCMKSLVNKHDISQKNISGLIMCNPLLNG